MSLVSLHTQPYGSLVVSVLSVSLLGIVLTHGATEASPAFGDPLPGLTAEEQAAFADGLADFLEVETVDSGLGPVFNGRSCVGCHNVPAPGGSSRARVTRFGTRDGKKFDPLLSGGGSLIQRNGIGQVGECTFVGEVVPPNATVVAQRVSTPLFGMGLVEAIPDSAIRQVAAHQPQAIKGKAHQVKDFGQPTKIGRFGHKAQAATVKQFAGDAYLNELGITSPLFPTENCPNGDCSLLRCDPVPDPDDDGSGVDALTAFMALLAPPPRGEITPQGQAGEEVFHRIGCAGCHVPTWTTGASPVAALNRVTFHPYSDFLLHSMGSLGDGIVQGQASGAEMRTTPLWGLRTRLSFLHDGRASTIEAAIEGHAGQGEAAMRQYLALTPEDAEALLAFLQTL